jgi:hypothetical protein
MTAEDGAGGGGSPRPGRRSRRGRRSRHSPVQQEEPTPPLPVTALEPPDPAPAPELAPAPRAPLAGERVFEAEGRQLTVRVAGQGVYGTGSRGPAFVVELEFFEDPGGGPVRRAVVPRRELELLHDDELRALYRSAIRMAPPERR